MASYANRRAKDPEEHRWTLLQDLLGAASEDDRPLLDRISSMYHTV